VREIKVYSYLVARVHQIGGVLGVYLPPVLYCPFIYCSKVLTERTALWNVFS
jgi:hypothetical protein